MPPVKEKGDVPPGTLDMLVLRVLSLGPMHGYAVAQHIERVSDNAISIEQGSLYPALERVQQRGWATSKWGTSPTGRRAKYYTITASGRRHLGKEIAGYERVAHAIGRVLRHT